MRARGLVIVPWLRSIKDTRTLLSWMWFLLVHNLLPFKVKIWRNLTAKKQVGFIVLPWSCLWGLSSSLVRSRLQDSSPRLSVMTWRFVWTGLLLLRVATSARSSSDDDHGSGTSCSCLIESSIRFVWEYYFFLPLPCLMFILIGRDYIGLLFSLNYVSYVDVYDK